MQDTLTLEKTAKGTDELESRRYKLEPALRMVLILIDGHSNVAAIRQKVPGLPELIHHLEDLLRQDFIQPKVVGAQAARSHAATRDSPAVASSSHQVKWQLIDMITVILGQELGDRICQKLLRADDTPEALTQALKTCYQNVMLTIDEKKAAEIKQRGLAILSR